MRGKLLLLDHFGAKNGTKRTSPLLYFADGENVVIVASKGGFPIAIKEYRGYADYQARSKGREIPLVVLEPRK